MDNSKLCANCPSSFYTFGEKIGHHPDAKSLLKSAEAGCPLYIVLADGFQQLIVSKSLSAKFDNLVSFQYQLRKSGLQGEVEGPLLYEFSASPKPSTPITSDLFAPFKPLSLPHLLRGTDYLMIFYVIHIPGMYFSNCISIGNR
jgi:hypothetical protein